MEDQHNDLPALAETSRTSEATKAETARELTCGVCGGTEFSSGDCLWPSLINEWQLSPEEVAYINRQQAERCTACGANLRSIALANAIRSSFGIPTVLHNAVEDDAYRDLHVLEINEAGTLSPLLRRLPSYTFGAYPEVDMHALPYPDQSFDLVVHSDTLEHVANPVHALAECRRVLKPNGYLCFTVPVVVGRMTRSRNGLPGSFHGAPGTNADDHLVHTEYGADAWRQIMQAGFDNVTIHTVEYPAALAFACRNGTRPDQGSGAPRPLSEDTPAGNEDKSEHPVALPPDFDAEEYLGLNPDVREAGIDPVEHYLRFGHKENRAYKGLARALRPSLDKPYEFDGLRSMHNHDFMEHPDFVEAYGRGVQAAGADYQWYWRVHMGLWAARAAIRVAGDFVECGVNRGFLSSAIMKLLNWDSTGRTFYLLDTFKGIDARYVSGLEKDAGVLARNQRDLDSGFYTENIEQVRSNFSEWHNTKIVVGSIPETLSEIKSEAVAFLHIDLNCSPPEVAAIESLWNRIPTGGMVLLDDYAYYGYQSQKDGMDAWARANNVPIASLPTGQGLIVKA
ncbi:MULTISPECIES: TylF/MycF/NovP-related O-methyltransferase [Burkholderia]|nr:MULTISPECIES: TylF/MycF/NovP-related O-methyltransferase [Burkholderia]